MAHYKHKRPKTHAFSDGYDAWRGTGNHYERVSIKDLRKPQMNVSGRKSPWRYRNDIEISD